MLPSIPHERISSIVAVLTAVARGTVEGFALFSTSRASTP